MGYLKVLSYADIVEVTEYERVPLPSRRKKRGVQINSTSKSVPNDREDTQERAEQASTPKPRQIRNKKRAIMALRRLVQANLSPVNRPLLVTLTYAENMQDRGRAWRDFRSFVRDMRVAFPLFRYVAVTEYQKRGAIHFHALVWGVPFSVARAERDTRLVAGHWGHGYIDLVETDGRMALANYLIKYFAKAMDELGSGKKAYTWSRNMLKPERFDLVGPFFHLSTVQTVRDVELESIYLGKGRFRKLIVHPKILYESNSNPTGGDYVEEGR